MGEFAPVVVAKRFERVSDAVLPLARQISVEHAISGAEEAQWVEMRGYLRRVHREGLWLRLELATGTSDFHAVLPATEDVSGMIGSIVRLHGVCVAESDAARKLTGISLWVPGIAYVQVEEPAPAATEKVSGNSMAPCSAAKNRVLTPTPYMVTLSP